MFPIAAIVDAMIWC